MNNDKAINLDALYECAERNKVKLQDGLMAGGIGEILMNIDDDHIIEAEDWIRKAIEFNKRNGMVWHLGKDYALYAELFKRKGDKLKAKENLGKAIEIFKECGADGWVEKYEKELEVLL
jgi:tetratricopeptide (TPR) repeat protein